MKIRRCFCGLTAGILAALCVAGCAAKAGSGSETVQESAAVLTESTAETEAAEESSSLQKETVQETTAAESGSAQSDGAESDVDRYEEIIDFAGDEESWLSISWIFRWKVPRRRYRGTLHY